MAIAISRRMMATACLTIFLSSPLKADASPDATLTKDWAILRCLGHATRDPAMRRDFYASAGALFQRSQMAVEQFNDIDALARRFLSKKYGGTLNVRYNGLKCIDFYHSRELQLLVDASQP